jgi:hypothetical protein
LPAGPGSLAACNGNLAPWRRPRPFCLDCAAHSRSRKVTRNIQQPTAQRLSFATLFPLRRSTNTRSRPPLELDIPNKMPTMWLSDSQSTPPPIAPHPDSHGALQSRPQRRTKANMILLRQKLESPSAPAVRSPFSCSLPYPAPSNIRRRAQLPNNSLREAPH